MSSHCGTGYPSKSLKLCDIAHAPVLGVKSHPALVNVVSCFIAAVFVAVPPSLNKKLAMSISQKQSTILVAIEPAENPPPGTDAPLFTMVEAE